MGDGYTQWEFEQLIRACFVEALSYHWEKLDEDERKESAFTCRDRLEYDGRWHEIIDGCVPVYTYDAIRTWLNLGMPDAKEEYGMNDDATIIEQVQAGIYMWADQFAGENFEEWHNGFVHEKINDYVEEDG